MNAPTPGGPAFKRQVVFRIGSEDWPLLEAAVTQHGSIQSAVLAGLRALTPAESALDATEVGREKKQVVLRATGKRRVTKALAVPAASVGDAEIPAREAAQLLGLKASTVRGYIRSGKIAGRYVGEPSWAGWVTTRAAVEDYRHR